MVKRGISTFPLKIMMGELTLLQGKEVGKVHDSKITVVGKK